MSQPSGYQLSTRRDVMLGAAASIVTACASEHPKSDATERAQSSPQPSPQPSSQAISQPISQGWPLWAVEREGGIVYLFGQTAPRAAEWNEPAVESVAARCEAFWVETQNLLRGNIRDLVAAHGVDKKAPLASRVPAPEFARVLQAAKSLGVPPDNLNELRLWLVAQTLDEAFYARHALTAERKLTDAARAANKPIAAEFPAQDDAFAWFGKFTPEQELEYLRYTLDRVFEAPESEAARLDAWSRGDLAPATQWVERLRTTYPRLYRTIVVERNRGWVSRIQSMLASRRPTFVIVGLSHLVGPDSMQRQLSSAGLSARRL